MKIEQKIILSYIFNVGLIIVIGFFAFNDLNQVLAKLRFMEIADDLNASFLEMRISEKNFFLYNDRSALLDIKHKIADTIEAMELAKKDIIKAVGSDNLNRLNEYLRNYSEAIEKVNNAGSSDVTLETKLRADGKKLREFSNAITRLERNQANAIIANSQKVLSISFLTVLLSAIVVGHFVSQKILRSLRAIETLTVSISKGDFSLIEGYLPHDELGSVMKAVNTMSLELKTREEELIQSKKLASIGILTAGVAHELANPLNNISMIAQNFQELYDDLSDRIRKELMGKVYEETGRIEAIVKNLLDFSRPKEGTFMEEDLNAVVENALKLIRNTLDISNIGLKADFEPKLPPVMMDRNQIHQVLVNLFVNAAWAMGPEGMLFVSTMVGEGGDTVKIVIRDTGKGIPAEYLPHIFDPFFSTKGVEGTGLGLSVSYGIVKNHKGTIKVESVVDKGTVFTVELPVSEKKSDLVQI